MTDSSPTQALSPTTPEGVAPAVLPQARQVLQTRLIAGLIFLSTMGLLLTAAWLSPSGQGMGTHKQLGLPSCGMLESTGIPCATCGMTTAFAYAADGNLVRSFLTQPGGCLLAILTATAAVASFFALVTGFPLAPLGQMLAKPATLIGIGVMIGLAWVYKILAVTGHIPGL